VARARVRRVEDVATVTTIKREIIGRLRISALAFLRMALIVWFFSLSPLPRRDNALGSDRHGCPLLLLKLGETPSDLPGTAVDHLTNNVAVVEEQDTLPSGGSPRIMGHHQDGLSTPMTFV
jgi:hypothetical protein